MTTQTRKTFYIGCNDKDTKLQGLSEHRIFTIITSVVNRYFVYGATIQKATGTYRHDNGEFVTENTFVVIVYSDANHKQFVTELKKSLNQESILVDIQKVQLSFE